MDNLLYILALIGFLGIGSQWLAWKFQLPAIVLMSLAGIVAGPLLGLLNPAEDFGEFLSPIISAAVAIILFEGGLTLDFRELKHVGRAVRRLVFPGVPIAWALGAVAAYYLVGLSWPVAILFAGILIVTGPTVITPMLRQANLSARPRTILKWEGIVNDPIGALLAVIVFEYLVFEKAGDPLLQTVLWLTLAFLLAALIGYVFARVIVSLFKSGGVPEFLKAPVLLSAVLACFGIADAIEHETGLLAVTAMGIAIANSGIASINEMRRFKENITIILVSGVFVVLTATLSLDILTGLDWGFAAFVGAILFLVRPITVWISTLGAGLPWRDTLLISWIAPRGIVAVAVSGFFALKLQELGYLDGAQLVPLSFAIVFATILAHGFTVKKLAQMLGLATEGHPGALIVNASSWSVELAKLMKSLEIPVLIADTSWRRLKRARLENIPVYYGEILSEATEHQLDLNQFGSIIAASGNYAYNALVSTEFAPEFGRNNIFQIGGKDSDDSHEVSHTLKGRIIFGAGLGLEDLLKRHYAGWTFQKTRITEKFTLEDYKTKLHAETDILFTLKKDGKLSFATGADAPKIEDGDTIISYAPPANGSAAAAPQKPEADNKTTP